MLTVLSVLLVPQNYKSTIHSVSPNSQCYLSLDWHCISNSLFVIGVLETISSLRKYEKRAVSLASQSGKSVERRFASAIYLCV